MKPKDFVRVAGCAAGLLLAATTPASAQEPCTPMGPGTVVTTSTGPSCVGCAAAQPELAGDGDFGTAARVVMAANSGDGFALRVTRPGAAFSPGVAGMAIGNVFHFLGPGNIRLRTYLSGVLQDDAPATDAANQPYMITATKPFDAIEAVFDGGDTTAGVDIEVFEACSAVGVVAEDPVAAAPVRQPAHAAVIADLSTGANPYHIVYRRPDWKKHPSRVIPGFPADAPALELTFGADLNASLAADEQKWRAMTPGVVYWIPGTNLLYLRTRNVAAIPGVTEERMPYELRNHGVWTAGVIADACRDCYLLVVSDPQGGFTYSLDALARHAPWVDVAASTQQAFTTDPESELQSPLSLASGPLSPYASAAKRWAEAGRLYFIAAGNDPVQAPLPDRMLPPWFTIVSGAYAECRGHEFGSGKPNEFVSEFVAKAPALDSVDRYSTVSGTSFSTPLVATRFAQALKIVRAQLKDTRAPGTYWSGTPRLASAYLADGKLTRDELYQAFADAAELFAAEEFTGPCGSDGRAVSGTPWVEMGWGYVGPDQAVLAADLILGRRQAPAKPAEQKQYMDAYRSLREAAGSVTP